MIRAHNKLRDAAEIVFGGGSGLVVGLKPNASRRRGPSPRPVGSPIRVRGSAEELAIRYVGRRCGALGRHRRSPSTVTLSELAEHQAAAEELWAMVDPCDPRGTVDSIEAVVGDLSSMDPREASACASRVSFVPPGSALRDVLGERLALPPRRRMAGGWGPSRYVVASLTCLPASAMFSAMLALAWASGHKTP